MFLFKKYFTTYSNVLRHLRANCDLEGEVLYPFLHLWPEPTIIFVLTALDHRRPYTVSHRIWKGAFEKAAGVWGAPAPQLRYLRANCDLEGEVLYPSLHLWPEPTIIFVLTPFACEPTIIFSSTGNPTYFKRRIRKGSKGLGVAQPPNSVTLVLIVT